MTKVSASSSFPEARICGGMRHISANCWLYVVILPRLSTTRTPSAVDSSVARSSDSDFRWSTSAGPRLRPFLISLPFLFSGLGLYPDLLAGQVLLGACPRNFGVIQLSPRCCRLEHRT